MGAEPLREVMFGDVRAPLLVLLARGAARGREVAVRTALGATTGRLARQFAVETLLLVLIAGAAGGWEVGGDA